MSTKDYGPADAKLLAETGMTQKQIAEQLGVSHNTVGRWKRAGWKRGDPEVGLEQQKKAVLSASKVTTEEMLQAARISRLNTDVALLNESELLKETARRTLVTVCHALEFTQANAGELVKKKPRDVGALLLYCGQAVSHAHAGWERYLDILRGLHGDKNATPVAEKMEEEDPMREVMARLEANTNAKKKAAGAAPGSTSVQ